MLDVDELRAALRESLAGFKIPRLVVQQPVGRAVSSRRTTGHSVKPQSLQPGDRRAPRARP